MAECSEIGLSELRKNNSSLKGICEKLDTLISEFKGFSGNVAKSNEEEVVECVREYFVDNGMLVNDVSLGAKIRSKSQILCELDGIITTESFIAVIEAKSKVSHDAILQLERACRIVQDSESLPIVGFIGGPLFPANIKKIALEKGLNVVELSGERFRVTSFNRNTNTSKKYVISS